MTSVARPAFWSTSIDGDDYGTVSGTDEDAKTGEPDFDVADDSDDVQARKIGADELE